MKELNRTTRLSYVTVIVVLVIVIGLLTMKQPRLSYQLTPEESLESVLMLEDEIFPEDVAFIFEYEDPGYTVVDIRNPYDFHKGHLPTAVNIPVPDLLTEENLLFFDLMARDSITVIIYGQRQLEANGPWMVLKQLGYNNIKVMLGGYEYYTTKSLDPYDMPEIPEYLVEEPLFDFAGIGAQNYTPAASESTAEPVITVRKKKKAVAEGGC